MNQDLIYYEIMADAFKDEEAQLNVVKAIDGFIQEVLLALCAGGRASQTDEGRLWQQAKMIVRAEYPKCWSIRANYSARQYQAQT